MGWIEKYGAESSSSTGSGTSHSSTSGGTAIDEEPQWYLRLYFEYIKAVTELVDERERAAAAAEVAAATAEVAATMTALEAPVLMQPRGGGAGGTGGGVGGGSPAVAAAAAFVERQILPVSPDEAPMAEKPLSGEAITVACNTEAAPQR